MTFINTYLLSLLSMNASVIQTDKAQAAILNAAVGDALGRITEFVDSTRKIYRKFGIEYGVTSLTQASIVHPITLKKMTPYTDDTVMSRIVLETAVEGRKENYAYEQILDTLARRFAALFGEEKYTIDPLYNLRAHGLRNIKAGLELNKLIEQGEDQDPFWFYNRPHKDIITEAGCGSVMRAWPLGLVFANNIPLVIALADGQSRITHRHPLARAASVAMAVGTAYAYNNKSVDETVAAMIETAELFDEEELFYKPHAQKFPKDMHLSAHMIARDQLLTSDMIRYAYDAARSGKAPHEILGTNNAKQENARSHQGFLLGWAGDEAVAAAVYLFVRHCSDPRRAIIEGVNTPGDSDSIASLAGALLGAKTGILYDRIDTLSLLENKGTLVALAASIL